MRKMSGLETKLLKEENIFISKTKTISIFILLNSVKILNVPKLIYRFNVTRVKS